MDRENAERELVLLAAGTIARREEGRERAEALAELCDWSELEASLRRRRLLTTLGPRVVALAGTRRDDQFAAAVEASLDASRLYGGYLQMVSRQIQDSLTESGVSSTPLKGPTLSERLYGDPGRRISTDLDLLVRPSDLRAAVGVIKRLGYMSPTDHVNRNGLPLLHFAMFHARDELPPVELHWRVHWYERRFAQDRLMAPQPSTAREWHPPPGDELLTLLLYYARDGFLGLRIATDIATWWDAHGGQLEPDEVGALVRAYPAYTRLADAAVMAASATVGIPAAAILGRRPAKDMRGSLAVRLADPSPTSTESQIYAEMGLVDGLLMPKRQLWDFVTRQILLAPDVLDEQARRAAHRRPRHTITHGLGVMARYAATLLRLLFRTAREDLSTDSRGKT